MRTITIYTTLAVLLFLTANTKAQEIRLTLDDAITMAADSSLSAIKAHRAYMSGYWEYRAYKAARKIGRAHV